MALRTALFLSNRSKVVCLPRAIPFGDGDREVVLEGPRLIIVPADASWDDVFDAESVDLGNRQSPVPQKRDAF